MTDAERIAQLMTELAAEKARSSQLEAAQVTAALSARDAQIGALLSELKLPDTKAEVTFSEPGEAEATAQVDWKAFLTSLDEQQFSTFRALAPGMTPVAEGGADAGLNFSEFDTATTDAPVELSQSDRASLQQRIKAARAARAASYRQAAS